ncbi:MAG: hypothetical protein HKN10_03660 [Myxococcales bacterium]|nr:hypothetical protein [Myxococcales bacterium]
MTRIRLVAGVVTCEIGHKMHCLLGRARPVFGTLFLALLVASSVSEAQIPKTVEAPYVAPPEQALLIFSRPRRRQASEVTVHIVNQAGRCIAVLDNGWQMAAPMWPGKHMLMVITGTAPPTVQLMEVRLSAGKTYVVGLRTRVNVKSPVAIKVLRPADQPLEAFPPAVRERISANPDLRKCTEWVSWKRGKIESRAQRVKVDWDRASDEHRATHTVHRNDGWPASEVHEP